MITEIQRRSERLALSEPLLELWEASVRTTHGFLTEQNRQDLQFVVKEALEQVAHLAVICEEGKPVGFIGAEADKVEMLFLNPICRGRGLGRSLMQYAIEQWHCRKVDVNEQNEESAGFYQHLGFEIKSRSALDGQGNPFPILHMELPL